MTVCTYIAHTNDTAKLKLHQKPTRQATPLAARHHLRTRQKLPPKQKRPVYGGATVKIRRRQSTKTLITNGFNQLNSRMDHLQMTESQTQTDVDNATTAVTGLLSDLSTQTGDILNDLTTLVNSSNQTGTPVSTSALDNIVSQVQTVQSALDGAVTQLNTLAAPSTPITATSSVENATSTPVAESALDAHPLSKPAAPELANPVGNRGASLMGIAPVATAPESDVPAEPRKTPTATSSDSRERVSKLIDDAVTALKAIPEIL
jgi:hypothetical protein